MNNYMQKIADMLGVELGEVFYVSWERNSNSKQKFALSDDGLYQIAYAGFEEEFGVKSDKVLMRIRTMTMSIMNFIGSILIIIFIVLVLKMLNE